MATTFWLLEETQNGYWLGNQDAERPWREVAVARDGNPTEIAAALRSALDEEGYHGEPVMFALDSATCLAVTMPHSGRGMTRNSQAMVYALEEALPLAAEEITCDFVVFANDALGVAVEVAALRPLLMALKEAGVRIASVVPAAMLALLGQVGGHRRRGRRLAVWQDGQQLDLFELLDGRPHAWRTMPARADDLLREIRVLGLASPESPPEELIAGNLSAELQEALGEAVGSIPVTLDARMPQQGAIEAVVAVLSGRQESWIELHRGELGTYDPYRPIRRSLYVFSAVSTLLLVALSVALWIRAGQYEAIAQSYQTEQEQTFRRVLPGARVPIGIRSRLESEYRTMAGITGQMEGVPHLESALILMRDALVSLPEDLRYRFVEIRAEENRIYLDGEVRQHGDADLLAAALRKRGLEVPAPRTEQLGDKGIAVVITADRPSQDAKAQKEGKDR